MDEEEEGNDILVACNNSYVGEDLADMMSLNPKQLILVENK